MSLGSRPLSLLSALFLTATSVLAAPAARPVGPVRTAAPPVSTKLGKADQDLMAAVQAKDLEKVKAAIEAGAKPRIFLGTPVHPLIMEAVIQDSLDIVKALLAAGASPNDADQAGE